MTTFVEFTQRLIRKFGKEKSEEEKPLPPPEETCTNVDTTMEEQPSSSIIGRVYTLEEGTLAALQEVTKHHQGMQIFPHSIVAANYFDQCGYLLLHDQG